MNTQRSMAGSGGEPLMIKEGLTGVSAALTSLRQTPLTTPGEPLAPPHSNQPSGKVSAASVEAFTRELANLLAAGLPLARALQLLEREASRPAARAVWAAVRSDVIGGMPLADSLANHPRTFSNIYVAMVRAGEAGGFLHLVLEQIAEFRTREHDLKGRIKAALIYPAVLAFLATAVLIFLLTFFIPRFSVIFADMGGSLPTLTRVIVGLSDLAVRWWPVGLVIGALAILAAARVRSNVEGRRAVERVVLGTPLLGTVVARFALVRFAQMLGTLIGAGVPLVQSLKVAREALGNETLSRAVTHGIEEVEKGASLSRSFAATPLLFPSSVVEMLAVAEETGRLEAELKRLAKAYEGDLDRRLRMLVALVEPLLLFVMAALIGTVVVGMLLPVFNLQDLIQ